MPSTPSKLLVVGFPEAGKTTFIAALWHVVSTNEVAGALTLSELQPDREHLNAIAKLWREWKKIPRTVIGRERTLTLNLRVPDQDVLHSVTFPDASGEGFRRAFEHRRWRPEFAQLAQDTDGVLFFVHPASFNANPRIDTDVESMVAAASTPSALGRQEQPSMTEDRAAHSRPSIRPWREGMASVQAKLVDLVQLIRHEHAKCGVKTVLMVSAWDLVAAEGLAPEEWVRQRAPLLSQYLEANREQFPYQVLGVSAQGAPLEEPSHLEDLLKSSERIRVVFENGASSDITAPLQWILG